MITLTGTYIVERPDGSEYVYNWDAEDAAPPTQQELSPTQQFSTQKLRTSAPTPGHPYPLENGGHVRCPQPAWEPDVVTWTFPGIVQGRVAEAWTGAHALNAAMCIKDGIVHEFVSVPAWQRNAARGCVSATTVFVHEHARYV